MATELSPAWLSLGSKHINSPASATQTSSLCMGISDDLLRLWNSYHSMQVARLTMASFATFALMWIVSRSTAQLSSWSSLQCATILLGLCAVPRLRLFKVSDTDSTVHRSWLLRACEVVVILQHLVWNLIVALVIIAVWMLSRLSAFVVAYSPSPQMPTPQTTASNTTVDTDNGTLDLLGVVSVWLGAVGIVFVFLQAKAFDRMRAHEQLHRGFGLDPTSTTTRRPPQQTTSWTDQTSECLTYGKSSTPPQFTTTGSESKRCSMRLRRSSARRKRYGGFCSRCTRHRRCGSLWWFAVSTLNPLHVACRQGDANLVRILLDAGMDPNALDKTHGERLSLRLVYDVSQGRLGNLVHVLGSPLHVAVASQHTDLIDVLVDAGADIDLVARSSFFSRSRRVSPVFVADSRDALERLISHGANFLLVPGTRDRMNVTVLQRVSLEERNDLAGVLRQWGGDVALTPLHAASAAGDAVTVRRFLSCGVPPDPLGEFLDGVNRRTPLHWASIMGRTLIVKLLIDYGADVDAMDADGRTPLHWAARHDHIETVAQLLEAGGDPSVTDSDGLTALAFGVAGGRVRGACVSLFAAAGVDINERQLNTAGDTCLHLALRAGHQLSALALVESGRADLRATNNEGEEAIDCCATATLQFAVKTRGGWTDVVVVHDASGDGGEHALLAKLVQRGIQENLLTAWMRKSDDEKELETSVRVMADASAVVCVLSPGFEHNAVCMEELAFAKERGVAVMAITTGSMDLSEELQVYLFTRQLVPFADVFDRSNPAGCQANDRPSEGASKSYQLHVSLRSLIDGLRDEVELDRVGSNRVVDLTSFRSYANLLMSADSSPTSCKRSVEYHDDPSLDVESYASSHLSSMATEFYRRRSTKGFQRHGSCSSMKLSVFLSHGDCHPEWALQIQEELELRQCSVTIDSMTRVSSMKERIVSAKHAILRCDVLIILLSEESVRTERSAGIC